MRKLLKFLPILLNILDNGIEGDEPDLDPMISNIIENKKSDAESKLEVQNHLPTWA